MGTFEEAVKVVQAAFEPGADEATRKQAAATLRSLLAVLEATPGLPLTGGGAGGAGVDVLGAIIEKFRGLVPAEARPDVPRLNIPIVPLPKP